MTFSADPYPRLHFRLMHMLAESNAQEKKSGMVVILPGHDPNEAFAEEEVSSMLREIARIYNIAVVILERGTYLKRAIDLGREVLKNKKVDLLLAAHGTATSVAWGEGGGRKYRLEDVRKEDFEGINDIYFLSCGPFKLAKKIAMETGKYVMAAVEKTSPETIFYVGSAYKGLFLLNEKGENVFHLFCPDGSETYYPREVSDKIIQKMERRVKKAKTRGEQDPLACEFLANYHCFTQRDYKKARQYAEGVKKNWQCQRVLYQILLATEPCEESFRESAREGNLFSQEAWGQILLNQKKYPEAIEFLIPASKRLSSARELLRRAFEEFEAVAHSRESLQQLAFCFLKNKEPAKAAEYFSRHIEETLGLEDEEAILSDEALTESIAQLEQLSCKGEKDASYLLAQLSYTGPLEKWGQKLGLFPMEISRLLQIEQWFQDARQQGHLEAAFSLLQFYCTESTGGFHGEAAKELFTQLKWKEEVVAWLRESDFPLAKRLLRGLEIEKEKKKDSCCLPFTLFLKRRWKKQTLEAIAC